MAYKSMKDIIGYKKVDWEKSEDRAKELYEFTQDGLDIANWEVVIPHYGTMSFNEFISKAKKEIYVGRYIEVTEAMFHLFANIQNHFDIVKTRFNDVFRKLLNTLEEENMTIGTVEEMLDESEVVVEQYKLENEKLKVENKKLRALLEFSNTGYYELWKIIEIKMDNLMSIYKDITNVETKDELLSYIQAIKTEIDVGLKPIKAKKNFLIKQQLENLGYSVDEFLSIEEKPKQKIEDEEEKEVIKTEPSNPLKPNTDKFKEELEKAKNIDKEETPDYVVTDEELDKENFELYTEFEIHNDPDLYDEDKWVEITGDNELSQEEREIRKNLIKSKLPEDDLYILESEIDYTDKSLENIARAYTLIKMEQELKHQNFGVNSVRFMKDYKNQYPSCLQQIREKKFTGLNPTYYAMFKKFNFNYKNGK